MNYEDAEISYRDKKLPTPAEGMKAVIISENMASPLCNHTQKRPAPVTGGAGRNHLVFSKHSPRKWLQVNSGSHERTQPRHPTEASSNTQVSLKAACSIPASAVALVKSHQDMTHWRVSPEQRAD